MERKDEAAAELGTDHTHTPYTHTPTTAVMRSLYPETTKKAPFKIMKRTWDCAVQSFAFQFC